MNRIEMYASSANLKVGLHRVLAVAHSLTRPLTQGENIAWWSILEESERQEANISALGTETLARIYARPEVRSMLDDARLQIGLAPLDHGRVGVAFRAAIISGRAHRAHGGRDVYGTSNKGLWDLVCDAFGRAVAQRFGRGLGDAPVRDEESRPSELTLANLRALCGFDTRPCGSDHEACSAWLSTQLAAMGFSIEIAGTDLGRPLVVARRPARGIAAHLVLYGHYDVTDVGPDGMWRHAPSELTLEGGRLYGRGVADNKGPLACRLAAIAMAETSPALTWFIQGEEEAGSVVASTLLPARMGSISPGLWLDETGYHDHEDGTLRLLARTVGEGEFSHAPDSALDELLRGLRALSSRWGIPARVEHRGLNKSVVEGGCPFNRNLPLGARYLAVGVNDSGARIHELDESLPAWTFPLHTAQVDVIFRWLERFAQRGT